MSTTAIVDTQNDVKEMLAIIIADQRFGIPIMQIQDVLRQQPVTKVPLSPPEIAGSLNLRGRIVTAIDVRKRLGIEASSNEGKGMSVVVEHENELYSLIIDSVGDVMKLSDADFENNPATLDPTWRNVSMGIYQLENELLVILDIPKLIGNVHT